MKEGVVSRAPSYYFCATNRMVRLAKVRRHILKMISYLQARPPFCILEANLQGLAPTAGPAGAKVVLSLTFFLGAMSSLLAPRERASALSRLGSDRRRTGRERFPQEQIDIH